MASPTSQSPTESDEFSSDSDDYSTVSDSEDSWGEDREELGKYPYMFEPLADPDSKGNPEPDPDEREDRLGNTDWCKCGKCQPMETARESTCCQEIQQMKEVMDAVVSDLECIVEHPGFGSVCLNRWVLDTAYSQYKQQYEDEGLEGENKKYRLMAQRQLARWCWKYLGRQVRVVLPSCAVHRIKQTFPV